MRWIAQALAVNPNPNTIVGFPGSSNPAYVFRRRPFSYQFLDGHTPPPARSPELFRWIHKTTTDLIARLDGPEPSGNSLMNPQHPVDSTFAMTTRLGRLSLLTPILVYAVAAATVIRSPSTTQ